jgi:hypothetical protein
LDLRFNSEAVYQKHPATTRIQISLMKVFMTFWTPMAMSRFLRKREKYGIANLILPSYNKSMIL